MKVTNEIAHPVREINGVHVLVMELIWADGGRSFDVYRTNANGSLLGACLTLNGSFDADPTDEQITTCSATAASLFAGRTAT